MYSRHFVKAWSGVPNENISSRCQNGLPEIMMQERRTCAGCRNWTTVRTCAGCRSWTTVQELCRRDTSGHSFSAGLRGMDPCTHGEYSISVSGWLARIHEGCTQPTGFRHLDGLLEIMPHHGLPEIMTHARHGAMHAETQFPHKLYDPYVDFAVSSCWVNSSTTWTVCG